MKLLVYLSCLLLLIASWLPIVQNVGIALAVVMVVVVALIIIICKKTRKGKVGAIIAVDEITDEINNSVGAYIIIGVL